MARADTKMLEKGNFFPILEFKLTDDSTIELPIRGKWTILLFYRGYW